jgi:enamine deaminase RidA (YjgF/YER057c/UK114 family)
VNDVPLVHTTQLLPLDSAGAIVGENRVRDQTAKVLDNLAAALADSQSGLDRIAKLNTYVTDAASIETIEQVLAERLPLACRPAVSHVVTRLPHADALVAIDAVATTSLDPGRALKLARIEKLYDAGTSHAALMPQGTRIYVAGQAEKGATLAEATRHTLESLRATLKYLDVRETNIAQLKAFLTPMADVADVRRELAAFFGSQPVPPVAFVEWESTLPIEIELVAWGGRDLSGDPVEFLTPPGMTASPVYSRVARVNHSRTIYVSGLYGTEASDAATETRSTFESLRGLLDRTGSDMRHLAKATYYVSTEAASKKLNELRPEFYDPARPPSASKAMVSGVGRAGKSLTLDMIAVPAIGPDRPEYGPAEVGHGLAARDADAGWISLFDGKTTFGWTGSRVEDGCLIGGETTTEFGRIALRADFAAGHSLLIAGHEIVAPKREFTLDDSARLSSIKLVDGARLRSLAVRPMGLSTIFDGTELDGWQRIDRAQIPEEKRPKWTVADGTLQAVGGPGAMEYHARQFGDLVLQLDIRTRIRHANGGVFFRSIPGDFMNGYEAQIYNRAENGDPSCPAHYSTGAIDDRQSARRLISRDHQFFKMTIIATGPHIATWINGHQLTDWTDPRPPHDNPRQGLRIKPGTIQLQAHDPGTDVEFKNIRIGDIEND